jgi:hypothetical protein
MSQYPLHNVIVMNALCNSNHYYVIVTVSLSQDPLVFAAATINLCHGNHYFVTVTIYLSQDPFCATVTINLSQ